MAGAGATRIAATCRALHPDHLHSFSSSSLRPSLNFNCTSKIQVTDKGNMKAAALSFGAVVVLPEKHLSVSVVAEALKRTMALLRLLLRKKQKILRAALLLERVVIGCQSFTFIAVAGSLMGSILCFFEGCTFIIESFFNYFTTLSQSGFQEKIMQLLVKAIEMFLLGSALLTFSLGLYMMFLGSNSHTKGTRRQSLAESSLFGLFSLKRMPSWMEMQSISQAKSNIGHAILLMLQAGVLDKFKNVPLVTGLDLACFAGAVFISSACIFLLSKLTVQSSSTSQCSSYREAKALPCRPD